MGANVSADRSQPSSRSSTLTRMSHGYIINDGDVVAREKKKKASKFATLRKKLIRVRRHSRAVDYSKALRELTSTWSIRDLSCLVEEYEATAILKELAIAANLARPLANSIRQDLSTLFDYKYCTDVDLIYRGACFPAHRALLVARSPFFHNLLSRYQEYGAQVPIKLKTPGVDVPLFSALLRYLYTEEFTMEGSPLENEEIIMRLTEEFGMPNPLEQDLRMILETGDYSDATLVFTNGSESQENLSSEATCSGDHLARKHELRCHKAILAARSPFFRNLLLRRARSGEEITERTLHTPTRIVLDESVIPRRYARVLLHAIYMDSVDLSLIVRGSTSTCSLSEVQAMVAGRAHITHADEAMEIYQIGQFLDFPVLSQGCEDIIVESIAVENLTSILTWSSEPHGSQWVHRQALHFLREEFLQLLHSPLFCEMSKDYLIAAICSDFLQAGELDVLNAVLKWGEHQLVKRIEEREPNLLNHTAHSVSKKGIRKRDLNDVELREILAELLPHIRMDHVIPSNSEVLNSAIKRGLVSTPPSHMIADEGGNQRVRAWIRAKNNGMYVKPRLFTPYYEETKSMLEEHLGQVQENDMVNVRMIHMSSIPDTLYMVEDRQYAVPSVAYLAPTSTVDVIAGTIPVPDRNTLIMMLHREQELQRTKLIQKAYSLPYADKRAVTYQIKLRVVREFGLPDSAVEILQNSQYYYPEESQYVERQYQVNSSSSSSSPSRHKHSPSTPVPSPTRSYSPVVVSCPQVTTLDCVAHCTTHPDLKHSPSTPVPSPTRCYSPVQNDPNSCGESALSDMMPDIAMATASLNQMHMHESGELDLDIVSDGNHHGTLYV